MTLQIKQDGYYIRRDGLKVGPMKRSEHFDEGWDWTYHGCDSAYWIDGHFNYDGTPCREDLVVEWSETDRSAGLIISEIEERLIELRSLL